MMPARLRDCTDRARRPACLAPANDDCVLPEMESAASRPKAPRGPLTLVPEELQVLMLLQGHVKGRSPGWPRYRKRIQRKNSHSQLAAGLTESSIFHDTDRRP